MGGDGGRVTCPAPLLRLRSQVPARHGCGVTGDASWPSRPGKPCQGGGSHPEIGSSSASSCRCGDWGGGRGGGTTRPRGPSVGAGGVVLRFPQAPLAESVPQGQLVNPVPGSVPGPTLGVHLISSESSQPPPHTPGLSHTIDGGGTQGSLSLRAQAPSSLLPAAPT